MTKLILKSVVVFSELITTGIKNVYKVSNLLYYLIDPNKLFQALNATSLVGYTNI